MSAPGPIRHNIERDCRIANAYAAGSTLRECGLAYELSPERVRQIVIRQGVALRKTGSGK